MIMEAEDYNNNYHSNDNDDYNIQISLTILSFPDEPADVVRAIGIKPTRAAKKGSKDHVNVVPRQNIVSYRSEASGWGALIEEHWKNFKCKFKGKEDFLKELSKRAEIKMAIIVKTKEEFPVLFFERDFIEFVYKAGISQIDIDVCEGLYD